MRLLGNADAPRVVTNGASGTVLPRSGDPNASPEALTDANASVLDTPAPASAGPQTVAEAQAAWSADMLQQREAGLLTAINCARQARQLPALTLDAQLSETAGAAWLRLVHEPSFSLMQLPGTYTVRSVLPLNANAPHVAGRTQQDQSSQVASTRIPARAFLIAAGLIFVGGLMVVAGADILKTVKLTGVMIVIGLAVFELRCWGRSTPEVLRILLRHARRPHRLRLEPRSITLPPETSAAHAPRRPRWQT